MAPMTLEELLDAKLTSWGRFVRDSHGMDPEMDSLRSRRLDVGQLEPSESMWPGEPSAGSSSDMEVGR